MLSSSSDMSESIDLSFFSLFVTDDSCTVIELLDDKALGLELGLDINGKYAVVTALLEEPIIDSNNRERAVAIGDVLISVNEHMTLNDEVSDILLFLETLRECGLQRKMKFLDPLKVAEAAHIQTKAKSKDLLGFSRDLDYLLGERVYNNANLYSTAQRDLEWVAFLKHIGGPDNLKPAGNFKPSAELKHMVRRGIPAAFRSLIWQKVSLSSLHRLKFPPNYYEDLKAKSHNLNKKVADDIEKDVKRTFPEHEYFDRGVGGDSLRCVLKAYAAHNPTVGYCQSLNFISGMMLLFLQEEDAFWLLLTVVDTLLPKDCYSKSMIGTHVDQLVLAKIIESSLPEVHTALARTQLQLSLVTVPWFMCLFVNTLRPEVTLRVWDMFFCEGSKVLFRISAALLKKNETALISASSRDFTEMFLEMRSIGRNELDADALIAMAYKSYSAPSKSRIFSSRSTGSVKSTRSRGRADQSMRRYCGLNRVPSDLIGMGLAHTGPVIRPPLCDVPVLLSTSSDSKEEGEGQEEGEAEGEGEEQGDDMQSLSIERKEGSGSIHGSNSAIGNMLSSDTICTDRSSDILAASPLNGSCLSLFRNKSSDQNASNTSLSLKFYETSSEAKANYSADCCFDKSTASAIMQLGISTFNSTSTFTSSTDTTASEEVECKPSVGPSDASPSSTANLEAAIDSPRVLEESRQIVHSLSARDTDSIAMTKFKKEKVKGKEKENRKPASLFNMLLSSRPSNAAPVESTDKYRRFKRAEIELLRAELRPALLERFAALENTRAVRGLQEDNDSKILPK